MDMENTETLGLGQMVDRVSALALASTADVLAVELPAGALSAGALVDRPTILAIKSGDGTIELKTIAPLVADLLGKPPRRKGIATVTTLDSFNDLVNRNGDDATVIFVDANWRQPKLTAVLNYHVEAKHDADIHPVAAAAGDDQLARFGDHRVVYAFPLSEAWKTWVAKDGKVMPPEEFAQFLEEHVHELAMPDIDPEGPDEGWAQKFRTRIATPNELVDLARGLEINVGARIKTKTRLDSGETSIVFETEHRDVNGATLTVPGLFLINLPIFYRGVPQRILVRLRYRAAGEKGVVWFYEIFRPDEAVDERVRADVQEVAYQTGRPVIDGAPEV